MTKFNDSIDMKSQNDFKNFTEDKKHTSELAERQ